MLNSGENSLHKELIYGILLSDEIHHGFLRFEPLQINKGKEEQMILRIEQSNSFNCAKCGFETSGIVRSDSVQTRRWCPACGSPLFQCNHCCNFTSGTITNPDVICDSCKKAVEPKTLSV